MATDIMTELRKLCGYWLDDVGHCLNFLTKMSLYIFTNYYDIIILYNYIIYKNYLAHRAIYTKFYRQFKVHFLVYNISLRHIFCKKQFICFCNANTYKMYIDDCNQRDMLKKLHDV